MITMVVQNHRSYHPGDRKVIIAPIVKAMLMLDMRVPNAINQRVIVRGINYWWRFHSRAGALLLSRKSINQTPTIFDGIALSCNYRRKLTKRKEIMQHWGVIVVVVVAIQVFIKKPDLPGSRFAIRVQ